MRKFKSTRSDLTLNPKEAIIAGLAEDNGLFVPTFLDEVNIDLEKLIGCNYSTVAFNILKEFLYDFTEEELYHCINNAYDQKWHNDEIVPLSIYNNISFAEIYHGKTQAFKDIALSILPYFMTTAIQSTKENKEIVILTATSGDTGKAALAGFGDVPGISIAVFFPLDGVSAVQELQMTTEEAKNSHVIKVKGNFDDCQTGVKQIFKDSEIREIFSDNNIKLSSANSINIGRLLPQIVYYFTTYLKLVENKKIELGDKINFVVPTGNFGNILAGYYAQKIGLPINKLICASNDNKVLTDFLNTGHYDIKQREMIKTISPSMDILISSNVERLLFDLSNQDSEKVKQLMDNLTFDKKYEITELLSNKNDIFYANFATVDDTLTTIKKVYDELNYVIDPHTAVGYKVYEDYKNDTNDKTETVILSTASPYKFPESVIKAIKGDVNSGGIDLLDELYELTNNEIPKELNELRDKPVKHETIIRKEEMKSSISKWLLE